MVINCKCSMNQLETTWNFDDVQKREILSFQMISFDQDTDHL